METIVGVIAVFNLVAALSNLFLFRNAKKLTETAEKQVAKAESKGKEALRDRECAVSIMKGAIGHINGSTSGDFIVHLNDCERCRFLFKKHSSKKELN
jgi:hypothetical protein